MQLSGHDLELVKILSSVLGWIYFLAWSLSFYPQPWLNYRRKSTHGLAIDFPTLNVLGFGAYSVSTTCFLFSESIKEQYATRHPHAPVSTVRFNDFAFAVHGLVLVLITYSQFYTWLWGFNVSSLQRMSTVVRIIVAISGTSLVAAVGWVFVSNPEFEDDASRWNWIDVMYILSYVKLVATFVKYIPQAWVNFKRKSTKGWSIGQILCDFIGSVFSMAQLLIDASFSADWSGISGNPIKFGLANIGLLFDTIFILQHFVFYRNSAHEARKDNSLDEEQRRLLD